MNDDWTHITIERTSATKAGMTVFGSEWIDGALFVTARVYDAGGRLEQVRMIRGDLVKAVSWETA